MGNDESLLLTVEEAARLLRVGRNTLWAWERRGHGPEPIHVGSQDAKRRTLRYRRADLIDFIGGSDE
jgi:hypothetical protein